MDELYTMIVRWLFSMFEHPLLNTAAQAWISSRYSAAKNSTCGCPGCYANRVVVSRAFFHRDIQPLLVTDPWTRIVTLMGVTDFIEKLMPPIPEAERMIDICRGLSLEIQRGGDIGPLPRESALSFGDVGAILKQVQDMYSRPPSDDAGESTAIDSNVTQSKNDDDYQGDTMAQPQGSNIDKTINTHLVGTAFFKDGARIDPPPGLTYRDMMVQLGKQAEEEERTVGVHEVVNAFVLEGAYAFQNALKQRFGWVGLRPVPPASFFEQETPPQMLPVQVSPTETVQVIWGRVVIPGIAGWLETGIEYKEGRFMFLVTGEVQQKFMPAVRELMEMTKKNLKEFSIYKGQALRLTLPTPGNKAMFSPSNAPIFMDLSSVKPDELIFSNEVGQAIQTQLLNPIKYTALCRELGITLKRGILLAGAPGTGKTQTAAVVSKACVENGWTCFYVTQASDIAAMYRLAAEYAPAVLLAEDIDRIGLGEERTPALNELINTLDGVDTKGSEVMVIFTTNRDPREMNSALKRSGRLDVIMEMTPPDADAAKKLIELYSRGRLIEGIDLNKVSSMLAGQIPATIKEVCSRALLSAVSHMKSALTANAITASDLETSAYTMLEQIKIATAEDKGEQPEPGEERAADILGARISDGLAKLATAIAATTPASSKHANGHGKETTHQPLA